MSPSLAPALTRRNFLTHASCFGAYVGLAQLIPLSSVAAVFPDDPRVSQSPIVDKGFASVRKVGAGLYATISDPSKGFTTICNGGFLIGKDSALLLEGFGTPGGAAFQMETFRSISKLPVMAMDTHHHFDHCLGNSFYGEKGVPLFAHASVPKRLVESYGPMQGADKAAVLAPFQAQADSAKTPVIREHAQGDIRAVSGVFDLANSTLLSLPNHPINPSQLPYKIELGGLSGIVEAHPGHSGTDLILRIPQQNVVYTGDLLFSGWYPVAVDEQATISGWRQTLKLFASYDKDTIFVPGHGQICGQEGVKSLTEVFDDIAEQAEKSYKAGVPVQDAIQQYVVPDKFKNWPIYSWGFTIGPTITKLYAEWQSK